MNRRTGIPMASTKRWNMTSRARTSPPWTRLPARASTISCMAARRSRSTSTTMTISRGRRGNCRSASWPPSIPTCSTSRSRM
ncbi:hypothetical protein LTR94_037598, partial [Friedmanniomyces endolithicus]